MAIGKQCQNHKSAIYKIIKTYEQKFSNEISGKAPGFTFRLVRYNLNKFKALKKKEK